MTEHKQLPLFIGFVTQDQPKELLAYFESQREPFRKRAEAFEQDVEAAVPKQWQALLDFAGAGLSPAAGREGEDGARCSSTRRCGRRKCRTRKRSAPC